MLTSRDLNQKSERCPSETSSFPRTSILEKRAVLPKGVCTDNSHD